MDRNVLTATVLIAIILAVWLIWLTPETPNPAPTAKQQTEDSAAVAAGLPENPDSAAIARSAPADTMLAAASRGTDRTITVVSELYTAKFSTRGATLRSFVLSKYKNFDQKTPVQLVDTTIAGSIGLAFTTPSSHLVDTRSLYFNTPFQGDRIVVGKQPVQLVFEARLGKGFLRQTYIFKPDTYEIDLNVQQINPAAFVTREGYDVVWNGGLPWTENDPLDEARHSAAYAMSGGETEYIDLNKKTSDVQRLSGQVTWTSVKNKYFTSVIIPGRETRGAELEGQQVKNKAGIVHESYTTRLNMGMPAAVDSFTFYIGPLEYYRITDYKVGLYEMVDYGYDFFEWITRPLAKFVFIPLFTFLGSIIPNYGVIIIIFALLMKLALYPLTQSSFKSMAKMRDLQPRMEAIKEKYANDPQKQQEAMMRLYKETGVNPLGGCLPMLLQWPVLIALYQFIPQSISLRQASFLWAKDLSAPDVILHLPFNIPMYGDFVAGFTLLMGLSMVVQMKMTPQAGNNAQAKMMTYMMPVMLFLIFNRFASGLSLYYLVFNIASSIQQYFVNKKMDAGKATGDGSGSKADATKGGMKKPGTTKAKELRPAGKKKGL